MEESLEGWSYVLERQRMKVSRSTTEYVRMTESEGGVTEKMQGAEVVKTDMFKYLCCYIQTVHERGEGESVVRVEWVEVSVTGDL